MKCDVGPCRREARVFVTFSASGATTPYCDWHAYDRQGNLRWSSEAVAATERIS